MKELIETRFGKVRIGSTIRIDDVDATTTITKDGIDHQALEMKGKTGTVTYIDDADHIQGTWGGLYVLPEKDKFTVIKY